MSDWTNSFVILLYHGVSSGVHRGIENASKKHIPTDEFDAQMALLCAEYNVLPFDELLLRQTLGKLPPRSVAVTFDDGFANNATDALPVLVKHGIPATFYLSTGFIDSAQTFWVDKLEYLINETSLLSVELPRLSRRLSLATDVDRLQSLKDLKHAAKQCPGLAQDLVRELETRLGVAPRYDYPDYRTLTWDQVRFMKASGLCAFGAHTVNHTILSHLSVDEQESEIRLSKIELETQLEETTTLFSYPEGQWHHFTEETIRLVKGAGFASSPTAVFGRNYLDTSPFELKRNMVGFSASFEACLEG